MTLTSYKLSCTVNLVLMYTIIESLLEWFNDRAWRIISVFPINKKLPQLAPAGVFKMIQFPDLCDTLPLSDTEFTVLAHKVSGSQGLCKMKGLNVFSYFSFIRLLLHFQSNMSV